MRELREALGPDALTEAARRLRRDPYWSFRALPQSQGQRQFVDRAAEAVGGVHFLIGGNRSGKSETGGWVTANHILKVAPARAAELGVTARVWVIGRTIELVGEISWKQKLRKFIHPRNIADISWADKTQGWPAFIRTTQGVEVRFKATAQDVDTFQGDSILFAWFDEQFPQGHFEETRARCADYDAPIIGTLTPVQPDPFLEEKYHEPPPTWSFDEICIDDNRKSRGGYLGDDIVDRLIAEWPDATRETRRYGKFAGFEGAVYQEWSRSVHVRDFGPGDIPVEWERRRGIDFGFHNPFCCLWAARDPDGRLWFYDEHYLAGATIEHHAKCIKEKSGTQFIRRTWADTGGDTMPSSVGEGYKISGRRALAKAGIQVLPARRDLAQGIEEVQKLLSLRPTAGGDTLEPRIFFSRTHCPNAIREMATYRYPSAKERYDQPDAKEAPIKRGDHAPDCVRYIVFSELSNVNANEVEKLKGNEALHRSFSLRDPLRRRR